MITEHIVGNVRDGVTETVVNIPFEWFETEKEAHRQDCRGRHGIRCVRR